MPKKSIKKSKCLKITKTKAPIEEEEDSLAENLIWKCKCGHIEHGTIPPEDCPKCLRISQFKKVSESKIRDLYDEEVLSAREDIDDFDDLGADY